MWKLVLSNFNKGKLNQKEYVLMLDFRKFKYLLILVMSYVAEETTVAIFSRLEIKVVF